MGTMPLKRYADWLKSSWCHIYFSEPFVTSWSFIEAVNCGIPMVASSTKASLEYINLNKNLTVANHKNPPEILCAINDKIRFFGNFSRRQGFKTLSSQDLIGDFCESHETSLASLIADEEAATNV